jgi:hypothetical protein
LPVESGISITSFASPAITPVAMPGGAATSIWPKLSTTGCGAGSLLANNWTI